MIKTHLTLQTHDAKRIINRLAKHWSHKFEVSQNDDSTIIPFSADNQVIFRSNDEQLIADLTTLDDESQTKLQSVILNHINRMAGTEFDATWQNIDQ